MTRFERYMDKLQADAIAELNHLWSILTKPSPPPVHIQPSPIEEAPAIFEVDGEETSFLTLEPSTILITGATGQVGSALVRAFTGSDQILTPTRTELDLADEANIRAYLQLHRPAWIINPAAYTAVDKAESEPALAHAINAEAPRILGEEAAKYGAIVIHYSTDYVFDGAKSTPYVEADPTNPTSVYGRTKLAGELALAATGATHLIFRTSWVYAATGKNFLLTILRLARQRGLTGEPLRIVADQHGAPTSARQIAETTREIYAALILAAALCGSVADAMGKDSGVYHLTGAGETTWHGFAAEILRLAHQADPASPLAELIPIPSSEFPTPAKRPANSRLNCTRLLTDYQPALVPWQQELATIFAELSSQL